MCLLPKLRLEENAPPVLRFVLRTAPPVLRIDGLTPRVGPRNHHANSLATPGLDGHDDGAMVTKLVLFHNSDLNLVINTCTIARVYNNNCSTFLLAQVSNNTGLVVVSAYIFARKVSPKKGPRGLECINFCVDTSPKNGVLVIQNGRVHGDRVVSIQKYSSVRYM